MRDEGLCNLIAWVDHVIISIYYEEFVLVTMVALVTISLMCI